MRTLAVLLAVAVLFPAGMVSVFPASARHAAARSVPADAGPGPSLMPPDPVSGRWPAVGIRSAPSAPLHPAAVLGLARVLVLLIQFTNVSHDPSHEAPYFDDFFNNATPAARSMRAYFREASYGGLTINATIVPTWFTSSHPMEYYGKDGTSGVDNANAPIYYLVDEAVRAADPSVDFTSFDTDHDGVIDHLVVVHAGPGQENHANLTDAIWSHSWNVYDGDPTQPGDQLLLADGVQVFRYTMISEDSPLGVMAHEFGHDLALPDLYDTDGSSDGAGVWDPMSLGAWNGAPRGSSPAEFSAWSKIRLGWVTPTDVTSAMVGTAVPAVETSAKVFRLGVAGTFPAEYFLVENRQLVGFDAALPGAGLLIWHVDESQTSNDVDTHRLLDLEEADEALTGDHPRDAGDPWHDTATGWGPDTLPDSRTVAGQTTGWRVREISASGPTMTATIAREITKDLGVAAIRLPFTAAPQDNVTVAIDVRNDGVQPADVDLSVMIFRHFFQPPLLVTQTRLTLAGLPGETTHTFPYSFIASTPGRYVVHADLVGTNDEIPSNDMRVAHVLVNTFRFRDDVESGIGGWTRNGVSNDEHRWRIVNDTDPDGAAHSPSRAWRFGYVATLLPNPLPPQWHTVTSPTIPLSPGATYLIFYSRYDLTGRTIPVLPIGSNDTDDAYVEVSYNGGPWIRLAHYTGRDLTWRGATFDLSANISGPTNFQVHFNASSDVMRNSGGWWIDDVMIASTGLGHAAVLLGSGGPYETPAGGTVRLNLKAANVGEYETAFRLDAVLPAGWDAFLGSDPNQPLQGRVVDLAPDGDFALPVTLRLPSTAAAGSTADATISVTAVGVSGIGATLAVQVRVSGLSLLLAIGIVAALLIGAVVVAIVIRRRRPRL